MKLLLLFILLSVCSVEAQLLNRLDIKIELTNGILATNLFTLATNKYSQADKLDPDNRHLNLTLINNNNGSNYIIQGSLMFDQSNKIFTVYSFLFTNAKPAQSSGFVEWHQCPREGTQQGLNWQGCVGDPRSFYQRFIWP